MTRQTRDTKVTATGRHDFKSTARPETADREDPMSIADLTFDHQIVIWSLRMFLQGHEAIEKISTEFASALPPAAGRLAYTAAERIIDTLRRYGRRNIRLSCLCNALLTRDEISVLVLLISVQGGDYAEMTRRARNLVIDDGSHILLDAAASLMSALAARHADTPALLPSCLGNATVH